MDHHPETLVLAFEGKPVRIIIVDGEPWFALADLCAVYEIEDMPEAIRLIGAKYIAELSDCSEPRGKIITSTDGFVVLNFYYLGVFSDGGEAAKARTDRFRNWAWAEVAAWRASA